MPSSPLRFLPLAAIAATSVLVFALRLDKYASLEELMNRREALGAAVAAHQALSMALFVLIYAVYVTLSIPGASLLTLAGGYLFGGWAGGALSATAATLGAIALFTAARSSLGDMLRQRAGPWVQKFRAGFEADAAAYLLFLRLAPVFPFWLVNLVTAVLGIPLSTFVWTTFIGILPGTFVFALAGAGLESIAQAHQDAYAACVASGAAHCRMHFSIASLLTREMLLALGGLALLALAPVALKRLRTHKRDNAAMRDDA